jgi:imidazolonepropionase-like amidohydrolase
MANASGRREMVSRVGVHLALEKCHDLPYRECFPAMLRLLKAVSDAGITIIPGTDALPGYSLHHELELYVRAGIPAPEVLRMATLTPSQVMGVAKDLGVLAAGKLADMILIDGDPAKNIRDTRNITTVIKGGKVFDPAAIEKALGIAPRPPRR